MFNYMEIPYCILPNVPWLAYTFMVRVKHYFPSGFGLVLGFLHVTKSAYGFMVRGLTSRVLCATLVIFLMLTLLLTRF